MALVMASVCVARGALAEPSSAACAAARWARAESLVADVERIVAAEESGGWFVDADAYREMAPDVLESVCRATPGTRRLALELLQREAAAVGEPHAEWERAGRTLSRPVRRALSAERRRKALGQALSSVEHDCPFWVVPDPAFDGRQTERDRFTLSLETGGMAQVRQTDGSWTLGGGGAVRLLPGYGFGGAWSLLVGAEFGGGAMIRPGVEPTELVINYFPALPVIVRLHHIAWHYDFEAAPVALFQADAGDFSYGARLGFAAGVFALRTQGVLPWAGAGLAYEHYFESGGRPRAEFLRGGLRVGVVWDP